MKPAASHLKCFFILIAVILLTGVELQAQFTSSNLPIILIETDPVGPITKERIIATMKVVNNGEQRNLVSGPYNEYDGQIAIKGRGSSSWDNFEKKGYTLETQLFTGENNNVSLLGMPAENDWVLHGPYADKTLMKNAFVYTIGTELGRYAPRHGFCELLINGEYKGVYLLVERIKRDANRVDIATLNPDENTGDDLTGGYIMRIDRDNGDGYSWKADFGYDLTYFNYYYPDAADMSVTQRDYIRNYIEQFEFALATRPFDDTTNGYRAFIDLASFIDYFIMQELTKNIDAYRLSTYFYKDKNSKGGKLTMGPIWDFNLSCGGINIGFGDWGAQAEDWVSDELGPSNGVPFWWSWFLYDNYYNSCLKERWAGLRDSVINEANFNTVIDGYAALLDEAKERNFAIYPLADPVWGNNHSGMTYAQEVDTLKGYLKARIAWMDATINSLPAGEECLECFSDCLPVVLGLELAENEISVFPNPAKEVIKMSFPAGTLVGPLFFEIYDGSGRILLSLSTTINGQQTELSIDLRSIEQQGLMTYSISSARGILHKGTLVKQ